MVPHPYDVIFMGPDRLASYFQTITHLCGLVESVRRFNASGAIFVSVTPEAFLTALNRPLDPEVLGKLHSLQQLIYKELDKQQKCLLTVCKGVIVGVLGLFSTLPTDTDSDTTLLKDSDNYKEPTTLLDPCCNTGDSFGRMYEISMLNRKEQTTLRVPAHLVTHTCQEKGGLAHPLPRGSIVDVVLNQDSSMDVPITLDRVKLIVPCPSFSTHTFYGFLSVFTNYVSLIQRELGLFDRSDPQFVKDSTEPDLVEDLNLLSSTPSEHNIMSYLNYPIVPSLPDNLPPQDDIHSNIYNYTACNNSFNYLPITSSHSSVSNQYISSLPFSEPFYGPLPNDPTDAICPSNAHSTLEHHQRSATQLSKSLSNLSAYKSDTYSVLPSFIANVRGTNKLLSDTMQRFNSLIEAHNPMLILPLFTRFRGRIEFMQDGYGCIVCPPIDVNSENMQRVPGFMNSDFIAGIEQMRCSGMHKIFQSLNNIFQDFYNPVSYKPPNISTLNSFSIADGISLCCFFAAPLPHHVSDSSPRSFSRGDIVEFSILHEYGYECECTSGGALHETTNQHIGPLLSNDLVKLAPYKDKQGTRENKRAKEGQSDASKMQHSASAPTISTVSIANFSCPDLGSYRSLVSSSSSASAYITLLANQITTLSNVCTKKSHWHAHFVDGHVYYGIVYSFNDTDGYGFIKSYAAHTHAGTLSQGLEVYFRPNPTLGAWKPEKGCFVTFKAKWVDNKPQARDVKPLYNRTAGFFFGQCLGIYPPFAIIRALAHTCTKFPSNNSQFTSSTINFLQNHKLLANDEEESSFDGVLNLATHHGGIDPNWANDLYFLSIKSLSKTLKNALNVGSYVSFNVDPDISTHMRAINLSMVSSTVFLEILAYLHNITPSTIIPGLRQPLSSVQTSEKPPWSAYFQAPTRSEPTPLRAFTFYLRAESLQLTFRQGMLQHTGLPHAYQVKLSADCSTQTLTIPMESMLKPIDSTMTNSQSVIVCTDIGLTGILPNQICELGYYTPNLANAPSQPPTMSLGLIINSFLTCYAMQVSYITDEYVILNSLIIKYDSCVGREYVEPSMLYVGIPRATYPSKYMSFGMTLYLIIKSTKMEQLVNSLVLGKLSTSKGFILAIFILSSVKVELVAPIHT